MNTKELNDTIKKNEIMPFAAIWMDLKIIISEVSQRQILYITYMQNIKNSSNELIYKIEIDSQIQKTDLRLPKGKMGGINQEYGINRCRLTYEIDKQQGFTVEHRELSLISCNKL